MADITTGRTDFTIELYVCDIFEFQSSDSPNFPQPEGRTTLTEGVSDT